jgi:MerR family transcriptional regulator, light-induced transcriptional regulator
MIEKDATSPQYPMRVVVRRTGLNPSLLRAWERRYGAVEPGRSDGGQRLYSEEDIRKLALLREAVESGHTISQIADLPLEGLRELVLREQSRVLPAGMGEGARRSSGSGQNGSSPETNGSRPSGEDLAAEFLRRAVACVHEMDTKGLESALHRGAMALSPETLVDGVLVPLLQRIGLLWREGEVGPASEHMASGVVRRFLDWLLGALVPHSAAPLMMVGTPAGHRHEFGALLAAVVAAGEGWQVVALGPDLPAGEIAEAARRKGAGAVALSAIHPVDDPHLPGELRALRRELTSDVRLLAGGPAALAHQEALEAVGVHVLADMAAFRSAVELHTA